MNIDRAGKKIYAVPLGTVLFFPSSYPPGFSSPVRNDTSSHSVQPISLEDCELLYDWSLMTHVGPKLQGTHFILFCSKHNKKKKKGDLWEL